MTDPTRLTAEGLLARLDARGIAAAPDLDVLGRAGEVLVLLVDDPARVPEAWDVGVILPEVLREVTPPLPAFVLPVEPSRAARARLGLRALPALVLLRDGAAAGAIEGLRGWDDWRRELSALRSGAGDLLAPPASPRH